ncbi:cation:proton antiporter [Intestinibacillus sp. Marseille-P6563]|uniref:cation:proton antiporter n=1 Tax=Intestinibacillus sp. Marseille-P6563 TaxID=2364792 RepID=UPI000F06FAB0|nr:cation:proton antiporter [Intestinibacillus sp. Marseille-P6563]
MESYEFLLIIAIILLATKILGLLSERVHMPQVVGALAAGILLGPSVLGVVSETDFLTKTSEIGVILLMFLAGLDTDLGELKKTGLASFVIAVIGAGLPLIGGTICYEAFFRDVTDPMDFLKAVFIGVVLTATSVSITVETLREMGKLKGRVGTAILGAAVIDDILGIIVLTVISGFADPTVNPMQVFVRIGLFFVFIGVVGFLCYKVFSKMDVIWSHHRRIAIASLAFCFVLSYIAEQFFGIADITGAYFAGLILCNIMELREYVAKKINIMNYMFFAPIFFASIGFKTELSGMNTELAIFSVLLLIIAVLTKVVGCGLGARLCGFNGHESLSVGVGMISRGEVALIVAQKGAAVGLISTSMFPAIVLVVIVTTLVTPILLKMVMTRDPVPPQGAKA